MSGMGYPEIRIFALKQEQVVENDHFDNKLYALSIWNVQLML